MPQGTLFTEDFVNEGIRGTEAWRSCKSDTLAAFRSELQAVSAKVANPSRLNEAQTEDRIVKPILTALGWSACFWVQERLETKGRANVPDYLLFGSQDDFAKADGKAKASERYPLAVAVGDAKAWAIGLDRRGSGAGADETPSGQILRYLSRAEVQSERKVQWAMYGRCPRCKRNLTISEAFGCGHVFGLSSLGGLPLSRCSRYGRWP